MIAGGSICLNVEGETFIKGDVFRIYKDKGMGEWNGDIYLPGADIFSYISIQQCICDINDTFLYA